MTGILVLCDLVFHIKLRRHKNRHFTQVVRKLEKLLSQQGKAHPSLPGPITRGCQNAEQRPFPSIRKWCRLMVYWEYIV